LASVSLFLFSKQKGANTLSYQKQTSSGLVSNIRLRNDSERLLCNTNVEYGNLVGFFLGFSVDGCSIIEGGHGREGGKGSIRVYKVPQIEQD